MISFEFGMSIFNIFQVGERAHSWLVLDKDILLENPKTFWANNKLSNNVPIVFGKCRLKRHRGPEPWGGRIDILSLVFHKNVIHSTQQQKQITVHQ